MQDVEQQNNETRQSKMTLVQSYLKWWEITGFDNAVSDKNVVWLNIEAQKPKNQLESSRPLLGTQPPSMKIEQNNFDSANKSEHNSQNSKTIIQSNLWPQNLDTLHKSLRNGDPLPGNIYNNAPILPRLIPAWNSSQNISNKKTIMLIADFPNEQDIKENSILSGKQNELIVNMMTACNFDKYDIYCCSLASTKPIYDEIPKQDLTQVYALMHHHIALLNPDAIISLGSTACHALLNAELMKSRENLHYFNHNNISKTLITTFHPRSLLAKPQLKQQAWRDLQVLMKKGLL